MTKKILIADKMGQPGIDILQKQGYEINKAWNLPKDELPDIVEDYDAIVIRSATQVKGKLLENAKNLKVIARPGIGLDNVDIERAKELGIAVRNTPNATTVSVAELAFTHILATTRNVTEGTKRMEVGDWPKKELKSNEVAKKTLGIIGFGRIGKDVAARAVAFDMNIIAYDIVEPEGEIAEKFRTIDRQWGDIINYRFTKDLKELLQEADYISLHAPLTPTTKHLISTEQFEQMKNGVRIIDCGRGGVMDLDALYEALKSGKVVAAGLDVFEQEPPGKHKLFEFPNVITTPHIGAQTQEGQDKAAIQAAQAIIEEFEKLEN